MSGLKLNRQTLVITAISIASCVVTLLNTDSFLSRRFQQRTLSNFIETVEVDYSSLQNLLAAKKWREADDKTKELIRESKNIANKTHYLNRENTNFTCSHFLRIDDLWVQYSNGRFGFSVQNSLYIDTGNNPEKWDGEAYIRFAERVGWRSGGEWLDSQDLKYDISAPFGHFPTGSSQTYVTNENKIESRLIYQGYESNWQCNASQGIKLKRSESQRSPIRLNSIIKILDLIFNNLDSPKQFINLDSSELASSDNASHTISSPHLFLTP